MNATPVPDPFPALSLVGKMAADATVHAPPDLLTIDEAAALLRSSVVTLRRRVKCGDIPAFRVLGRGPWLFRKDDVLRQLTPVEVSSAPSSPGPKVRTPPTAVDWGSNLAGATHLKGNHGA